jgi:hypothetical protein
VRRRFTWLAAAATVLVALAAAGASAGPFATPATEVTHWNEIAVSTIVALPPAGGGAPQAAPIGVAMVQGAVYDAVNAISLNHHQPYLLKLRFPFFASQEAAAATAAYRVLKYIVSTVPENVPFPARASILQSLASQYAASLAEIPDSLFRWLGIAAGTLSAHAMIVARTGDGRFGPSQWVPNSAPGHWQPLRDANGQPILDPAPWVGGVKPFVMTSSSQFRTAGPNDLSTAAWATEFNETKALGAANSTVRTSEQTYVARWWQSTPVLSWNAVARDLIGRSHLDIAGSARLLALQNLAGADAAINCWNDKYYWDFWRPWNAIQRALEDGNAATAPEPTWTPLISAPYPEHPSGHLCLDGAHTRVLQMFFGDSIDPGFRITSSSTFLLPTDERTRTFSSFSQAVDEITEARIWAGLHFRTADLQGRQLGRNVADYAAANFFQPAH